MNHVKQPKRVPGQYHLTLFRELKYNGLPVLPQSDGLVANFLGRLYQLLRSTLAVYPRTFAVRVDLRFPAHFAPVDNEIFSNIHLQKFFKLLRKKLDLLREAKADQGIRVHEHGLEYAWARECGIDGIKPHFHILLLLNGQAFRGIGGFECGRESLCNVIRGAWAEALGVDFTEGATSVHFPTNGQYLVDSRDQRQIEEVFARASYLAKVSTKNFLEGFHVFGCSRV